MAHKQYPDIAAARHMREQPLEPEKDSGRGKRTETSACPARPARNSRGAKSAKDNGYRKKRLIAMILTTLVCLSVPTLIILLILFG